MVDGEGTPRSPQRRRPALGSGLPASRVLLEPLTPLTMSHLRPFTLLALLATTGLFSCVQIGPPNDAEWAGIVDQEDPRTQLVLDMSEGYCSNDFAVWEEHIAEDAEVMVNDAVLTRDEVIAAFSSGHDAFEGIAHEDLNVTTMLYNNGTVFTNMWYTWTGKARATGEAVAIKGYCWMMWEGDQVVALYNAFDPTRYNEALAGDS